MAETPEQVDPSLERWVRNTLPKALSYARTLCSDVHAAEDLVHDCFCRLLAKREKYDLITDGWKLLLRSISNAVIDRHRKSEPMLLESSSKDEGSIFNAIPDRAEFEPLQIVMNREMAKRIEAALKQLPISQRTALELKCLGATPTDIAEALSITENNVGVLLFRARARMSQILKND
jgi:RNA polymerase sigma-70 factor, ECF subfamily